MTTIDPFIGRRIREIRVWRGMAQRAVAELAGISEGYLSRIESGKRHGDRRSLLEAIAAALRVAPSELAEQAFPPAASDPVTGEAQASVAALDAVLTDLELGEPAGQARPTWAGSTASFGLRPTTRPRGSCCPVCSASCTPSTSPIWPTAPTCYGG